MSVYKQQAPQTPKFSKGEIRGLNCPHAFVAIEANSDMGFLDHVDIVCSISDSECDFIEPGLDELDDIGLLVGGDSAADDGLAVLGHLDELDLESFVLLQD